MTAASAAAEAIKREMRVREANFIPSVRRQEGEWEANYVRIFSPTKISPSPWRCLREDWGTEDGKH